MIIVLGSQAMAYNHDTLMESVILHRFIRRKYVGK